MKKWFVAAAALVVFGIPAAFGASNQQTPKPATAAQAQSADDKATKACKAERASGAAAFAKKYGTNHNLKNAFGKCVSAQSKDDKDEQDEDKDEKSSAAAKACKARSEEHTSELQSR